MKNTIYFKLLKAYCDNLISTQFDENAGVFAGGFMCPSCKMIHGRSPDAVYPLAIMAKITGENKYLKSAELVFDYGKELMCTDGALYNDTQAGWRYTTVFHTISVLDTVIALGDKISQSFKEKLIERSKIMANWLFNNMTIELCQFNINYLATAPLALQLCGMVLENNEYIKRARFLADYAVKHISKNGLFYGESRIHDGLSALGCNSVDVGYDMEESLPNLIKYAHIVKDEEMLEKLANCLREMTAFMLPDGGLDNSFGCRNNKWTYWGSRTSDGCSPAYLLLADKDPMFIEAAYRNTKLLEECSPDGLLYGGPHYKKHGEYPCLHHTFEHACALAFIVDNIDVKYLASNGQKLPLDKDFFKFYPEINSYKIAVGNYVATITGYDYAISAGHTSGGTLSLLYGRNVGPMIAGSVTDYVLVEPTNQQQALDKDHHRSLVPRVVKNIDGELYSTSYYRHMTMQDEKVADGIKIKVKTGLSTKEDDVINDLKIGIEYLITPNGVEIKISNVNDNKFILPLISGSVKVIKGNLENTDDIFFLTGGFTAKEYTLASDAGEIQLLISEK